MKSVHAERIPQTVGSPRSAADSMLPRATFWRCGFDHIWSPNRAASHSLAGQLPLSAVESEVNYHGGGRIRTNVAVVAVCVWLLHGAGLSHSQTSGLRDDHIRSGDIARSVPCLHLAAPCGCAAWHIWAKRQFGARGPRNAFLSTAGRCRRDLPHAEPKRSAE